MFYLFPATNTFLKHGCAQIVQKPKKTWSKPEVTGLVADILIVATLCIASALALCIHLGVPLGPLNALTAFKIPLMISYFSTACVVSVIDLAKVACKRCVAVKKQQEEPEPKPSNVPDPVPSPPQVIVDPLPLKEVKDPIKPSDPTPPPTPLLKLEPIKKDSSPPKPEGEPPKSKPIFPPRMVKFPLIDFSEKEEDLASSFTHLDTTASDMEAPPQTGWTWATFWSGVNNLGKAVAQGTNVVATQIWEGLKKLLSPGKIQMRFYSLQVQFLVEQILTYNESTQSFDATPLPLPYLTKLQMLAEKDFKDRDIREFKERILQTIQENKGHNYSTRYYVLTEIENAFKTLNAKSPQFHRFLQQLCFQLYTGFDGVTYGEDIVKRYLGEKELTFKNIAQIFQDDQEQIKKLPEEAIGTSLRDAKGRLQGTAGVAFYPMLTNNFANQLWKETDREGHTVEIIRFGSPTSQVLGAADVLGADVLGQMNLFVQECQTQKKTVLSFQHQSFDGPIEAKRLETVKELAKKYPKTFYFLNLDMDSKFYHQKRENIDYKKNGEGRTEEIPIPYEDFKKSLVEHMERLDMSENLTEEIKKIPNYKKDLEQIADDVLKYFPNRQETMTRQERKDFIFLYYTRFRQYLHYKLKPSFSCHQCKDTMDRSMSLATGSFLVNAMDLNVHEDPQFLSSFRTLANFIGIIVKGSPMDHGRFDRFHPVLQRLSSLEKRPELPTYLAQQEMYSSQSQNTLRQLPCDAEKIEDYLACDLLRASRTGRYRAVMPFNDPTQASKLIQQIYRNNGLNCNVRINNNRFQVYQGNHALVTGEFVVNKGYLRIKIIAQSPRK